MSNKTGTVIVDNLNFRSGPGTNYSPLGQLAKNIKINIRSEHGGWLELDLSTLEGYISRAHVFLTSKQLVDRNGNAFGIIAAEALNVRTGPGYEYQTVTIVHQDQIVEIIEEHPEWFRVKTRGQNGFIMITLLDEVGPTPGALYLASINYKRVNMRLGPGLKYPIIAVLPENTQVQVLQLKNGWAKVETVVHEGFLRKDFVKITSPAGRAAEKPDLIGTATVSTNNLRLRSGPGENYPSLALLNSGFELNIRDMATSWFRVQPKTDSAYVSGKYVRYLVPEVPIEIPSLTDPLKPSSNKIVTIEDHFSPEQKKMATTWNQYGGLISYIGAQYSLDPTVALAVLCVESGGKGFAPDGRMIIRFENHYFFRLWGENNVETYERHFKFDDEKSWLGHKFRADASSPWQAVHTGHQSDEWETFQLASQFEENAAMQSISMGSPQIMGANYRVINYSSVEQMFHEFQADIRNQIWGLFHFIESRNLIPKLISEDFVAFAQVYNGTGQAENYGRKIEKHVKAHRDIFNVT